jgi:hypothetical protein
MNRSSLALTAIVLAILTITAPGIATNVPVPVASTKPSSKHRATYKHVNGFGRGVAVPTSASRVSSAACNRRTVGVNPPPNRLGPSGANSGSETLVAVPIGGNSVRSATSDRQLAELCAHQRR